METETMNALEQAKSLLEAAQQTEVAKATLITALLAQRMSIEEALTALGYGAKRTRRATVARKPGRPKGSKNSRPAEAVNAAREAGL